ncbi:hypothetical protein B0T26DRAFT_737850 [Lasiosphaeria miniovina]|uniref:Arrestin-like N-terminal domain-containing protein n=1 Tax=Lasiosphaeria miniovina TaxID=1954250 RepID=A0AA40E3U0_9PEZI|nr:uncharacterized protein B0T26DRAFT_737850 [Lasiosphaeria miniovina]KAK0727024.1 hypothetical protein B0T26DRAFT_737850 [Lasiosphaeria miniovina]
MSIRVALDNPPEFYTNLDIIRGQVLLSLSRQEHIGAVVVKLEGESRTALSSPADGSRAGVAYQQRDQAPTGGDTLYENHKILYKVAQVFPQENAAPITPPIVLAAGQHVFSFHFKFPFNNVCGDPATMARIGGIAGSGLFGLGGVRVMDGGRQLLYSHVTKTLPPSFTGFPGEAEIRYYIKVTIQRPGLFKENWRYHTGLKFLPIEPPRPQRSNREAYARRPYTFRPRSPSTASPQSRKRSSIFPGFGNGPGRPQTPNTGGGGFDSLAPPSPDAQDLSTAAPSIEMSARLPHPAILTCLQSIPLRLIAKKLVPASAEVFLVAIQIDLIGKTLVRCQNLANTETTRWSIVTRLGLSIPLSQPDDAVGTEVVVSDALWRDAPLPNTVMPSFRTCNLGRDYQIEVKLGLSWGKPLHHPSSRSNRGKGRLDSSEIPQEIHLPLNFSAVEVYSGMAPPPELVEAMRQGRGRKPVTPRPQRPAASPVSPQQQQQSPAPNLPPRPNVAQQQEMDPLYLSQLSPGQVAPPYDDAPPSYDEAMAEEMTGPMFPTQARPAFSGQTDENSPGTLPEKN